MNVVRLKTNSMRMVCSSCGTQANCDCVGAKLIPPGEFAAKVAKMNPEKSNRAIAQDTGVSFETVRRARKSVDTNVSTEKRVGKDGKKYKARKPSITKHYDDDADPVVLRANALDHRLHKHIQAWGLDFRKWLKTNPPKEARDMLYKSLQMEGEDLFQWASELL